MPILDALQWNLLIFVLIFCRWAGMIMLTPVFGARGVPVMVRLGLALGLSLIIYPVLAPTVTPLAYGMLAYAAVLVKEVLIGLTFGFILNLITFVMLGAGEFIDFQLGFIMGSTVDPLFGNRSFIAGNFLMIMTSLILLATNTHHLVIAALVKSYTFVPINPIHIPNSSEFFIKILGQTIFLSLQVAMPIYGSLVIANVGVGLLAKVVPQLNLLNLFFPVKITFGLIMFYLTITLLGGEVAGVIEMTFGWLDELFRGWRQ
ncbi:MAG: flagellar biosynthetic protein FliR [Peptococcaceae bacterium]|nr:flagellar biosynthetic protein FliR [Peptococcaceae bacterium]